MKKSLLALTLLFSSCAFAGSELELNKVKLPEAISLIYSEVLKVPYMLDPQLVNDERMITFRLTPDIDEREFVTNKARDRLPGGRLKSYRRVGSHFASCARWFDKSPS